MFIRLTPCAAAVVAALSGFSSAAHAADVPHAGVTVAATRVELLDTEAPYASEVHTREDIEKAGTHSLFDYLAQRSSLQVTPQWGNRQAPNITMRGFGEDGFQNVVISVNGRRLNNVDNVPALIGAISLADIERIEITKGSGAVMYGDGATAGSIQIYTRTQDSAALDLYAGNQGQRGAIATVGLIQEKWDLSATADHSKDHGFSAADPSGHRDQSEANTWRVSSNVRPITGLKLDLEAGASRLDNRFPNGLSASDFTQQPSRNDGRTYPQQIADSQYAGIGLQYQLQPGWELNARHYSEDKDTLAYGYTSAYSTQSNELALQYRRNAWVINTGVQHWDGDRDAYGSLMRKDNLGGFVHAQRMWEQTTVSGGLRHERVRYHYSSPWASAQHQESLTSWELGANHRLSPALTVFANISDAFATPDIDRFFDYATNSFQGFGEATKSRTFNIGANHHTDSNRLKASLFYAKLHDEIYFEPLSGTNTNIDRSHKYGVEVQDQWQFSPRQQLSVNYTWTRAVIDQEVQGAADYSGKQVPGVPRHNLTLGWNVRVADQGNLQLTHTWRSSHWAYGNFANQPAYQQGIYRSTDVSYRHQVHRHVDVYAAVTNLFAQTNSVAVQGSSYVLYPSNFARSWKIGAHIRF